MYSEWELMAISEDIEPGDTVIVESDDGEELLVFVQEKNKNVILFRDADGEIRQFSQSSLEEIGGSAMITGKSNVELSINE